MDMKFSDNEYVTPEALKNFDTEQTSQSAEYQRAISDPNMEIKEIAGQKYKYSPSTGRYMID